MSKSENKNISKEKKNEQKSTTGDHVNTGNYLRTLRLGKGLSTKDVTEATRISETNIKAIEDQDYSSLPADTFTRGLLNIYANFLGADAESVIANFLEERNATHSHKKRIIQKEPAKILAPKRLAEPAQFSSITMAAILLVIIIVSFTGYCIYTSWNPFSFLIKEKSDIQTVMKSVFPSEEKVPPQKSENLPAKENIITTPEVQTSEVQTPEVPIPQPQQSLTPSTQDEQIQTTPEKPVKPVTESVDSGENDDVATENQPSSEENLNIEAEPKIVSKKNEDDTSENMQTIPEENGDTENEVHIPPVDDNGVKPGDSTIIPEEKTDSVNENYTHPEENIEPLSEESSIAEKKTALQESVGYTVFVRFLKETSVDFTGDEAPIVTHEFNSGNIHTWYADSSLSLTFSQPNSAEILVNDSVIDFPEELDGNYTLRIPSNIAENQPDE